MHYQSTSSWNRQLSEIREALLKNKNKKQSKYGHCPNGLKPPSILGSGGALLRVNPNILQNATKHRKCFIVGLCKYIKPLNTKVHSRTLKALSSQNSQKMLQKLWHALNPQQAFDILPKLKKNMTNIIQYKTEPSKVFQINWQGPYPTPLAILPKYGAP